MAQKKFKQFFAKDFIGIDGESTPLEEDSGGANRAVNLEYAVGNSLRGRVGCQVAGQAMGFFSIFPYSYTRTVDEYAITYGGASLETTLTTADGATQNKLIGINEQVWVLDTMTIPVTRVSGAYPFTWYSTVSGSNIIFVIKANGTSILSTSLGDGISSSTSIYSLLSTIDGIAELSVNRTARGTCPPFAVVNGNQTTVAGASTTYGIRYTITVAAGHNFLPGDVITFPIVSINPHRNASFVLSVTATTITYVGFQTTLNNNDVLGYMNQAATGFKITTAATALSGTLNISFPYWRAILPGDSDATNSFYGNVFDAAYANWKASGYTPPTSANAAGCLYIATSGVPSYGTSTYNNNLIKIDGLTSVRTGLPTASMTAVAIAGGAITAGTYKYKCFLRRIDAQGNAVEGPVSSVQSVTYSAGNLQGTITAMPPLYASATGFQGRSAYKYLVESPAANVAFTVDDNSAAPGLNAFLQPGDPIVLMDNTAPIVGLTNVGTLHRTFCTSYAGAATPATGPASIKVADSSGYTIPDGTPISTGLTMVFLRTALGGNQYYVLCEIPVTGYANYSFTDNVLDTVLTAQAQYQEVELGKEHDPPPDCALVCQHQGGLVVARGIINPNTVAYSSIDGIEYFPVASNSFDVPSTQSGAITAIASDTDDHLAVLKERAYYDVVGDLDGGAFSINIKNEGDFGIGSQAALVRVQGVLIGPSRNGFILINNGTIEWRAYKELNARLIDQNYTFSSAVAVNDPLRRSYICTIPVPNAEPVTFVIDYSRDINHTFERAYATQIDPAGGFAAVGEDFYYLSSTAPYAVFRRLERFSSNSPSGNGDGDSFIDNTNAISYILETNPISNNEPDVLNTPIRLRLWSLPNDYVKEGWVPFATLVEGGSSPLVAYVGSASPGGTSSTVTFATTADIFKDVKLVSTKTHFYIVRLTTNTIRTSPFWTGFEVLYAESYNKEDLIK